jgi:hypothetical protein
MQSRFHRGGRLRDSIDLNLSAFGDLNIQGQVAFCVLERSSTRERFQNWLYPVVQGHKIVRGKGSFERTREGANLEGWWPRFAPRFWALTWD